MLSYLKLNKVGGCMSSVGGRGLKMVLLGMDAEPWVWVDLKATPCILSADRPVVHD